MARHETTTTTTTVTDDNPKFDKKTKKITDKFAQEAEFGNFLDSLGRTGKQTKKTGKKVDKLRGKLEDRGVDVGAIDINNEFGAEDVGRFRGQFDKDKKPRKSRLSLQTEAATLKARKEESQKIFDEEISPGLEQAQQLMDELLASPVFSPKFLADVRSDISGQVKQANESRNARIGASLGLRGLSPGSPVAAALADQAAQESDEFLVDQLRLQKMSAEQIEQSSQLMEIQASQSLAMNRVAARDAAIQGDRNRLSAINMQVAGIFEAAQQQRELQQLLGELERQGGGGFGFGDVLGVAGTVVGGIYGGPAGAAAGGAIGQGIGGAIDGASDKQSSGLNFGALGGAADSLNLFGNNPSPSTSPGGTPTP